MVKRSKTAKNTRLIKNKNKNKNNNNNRNKPSKTVKSHSTGAHSDHQEIIKTLLQLQVQVKFLHWNAKMYSMHMITDKFHGKLSKNMDELVEILLAQNVKLRPIDAYYGNTKDLSTPHTTHHAEKEHVLSAIHHTIHTLNKHSKNTTRDVSAVLDVIITDINVFKYLLSSS